jgi:hypothetical protein
LLVYHQKTFSARNLAARAQSPEKYGGYSIFDGQSNLTLENIAIIAHICGADLYMATEKYLFLPSV